MKMSKGFDSEKYICVLAWICWITSVHSSAPGKYRCIGFDIKKSRVREQGIDKSLESDVVKQANFDNLKFTSSLSKLKKFQYFYCCCSNTGR